jgi:hypothetical protein
VSLGIVVGIATLLAPWVRERIVIGVQVSIATIAYSGMHQ